MTKFQIGDKVKVVEVNGMRLKVEKIGGES